MLDGQAGWQDDRFTVELNLHTARRGELLARKRVSVSRQEFGELPARLALAVTGELDVANRQELLEGQTRNGEALLALWNGAPERALSTDPNFALAWLELARQREAAGNLKGAEEACRKALELDSQLPAAHLLLGEVYRREKNLQRAVEELEQARRVDPVNSEAMHELAAVLESLNRVNEAESVYLDLVRLRPSAWRGFFDLASFYERRERYGEAVPLLRRAIELVPERAGLSDDLARVYRELGRPEEAQLIEQSARARLR